MSSVEPHSTMRRGRDGAAPSTCCCDAAPTRSHSHRSPRAGHRSRGPRTARAMPRSMAMPTSGSASGSSRRATCATRRSPTEQPAPSPTGWPAGTSSLPPRLRARGRRLRRALLAAGGREPPTDRARAGGRRARARRRVRGADRRRRQHPERRRLRRARRRRGRARVARGIVGAVARRSAGTGCTRAWSRRERGPSGARW